MLKAVYSFFKKEPLYFWLLLVVLAFYGFFMWESWVQKQHSRPSPVITDFKVAEDKWNRDMAREGAFLDFAKREPFLAALFEFMTLFLLLAIVVGVILDVLRIWKPFFFKKFRSDLSPPPNQMWPLTIFPKVIILIAFFSLCLSFLMEVIRAAFFQGTSDNAYLILHTLGLYFVGLYFMIRFVRRSGGCWRDLGLRVSRAGFFREVGAGFLGYLGVLPLFMIVLMVLLAAANFYHYEPPAHPLVNIFLEEEKRAPFLMGLSLLLGTVVGPFFEEIFFRGFCYPVLRNRWGKSWGMVLSAAFFAGIHHSGFVFWPVFVLGIALAYLYEERRSLVASITLHITHNSILLGYFFLVKQIISQGPS